MKKSLALVLALIMVMGCMSFAAAEGEQFTDFNGTVTLSKLEGGTEEITLTGNTFTHTYNLDDSQWEEAFYNCGEDNGIYLTARFTLPKGAEEYFKSSYKGDATDEQCMETLRNAAYMGKGDSFGEGLKIAGAAYDGNNIIITPENCNESVIIKWKDNDGNVYFHRVNFNLTVSRVGEGIKLTNASPAINRVKFDTQAGANGSYSDGTVRYEIIETEDGFQYDSDGKGETITKLVNPGNATRATVNGNEVIIGTDDAIELKLDAQKKRSMTGSFTVCWLDADNKIVKTERITISNLPGSPDAFWLNTHWAPMDSNNNRINVQDIDFDSFFKYENGKLLFNVDNNADALNADILNRLSENELICEITPPKEAKYFKVSGQHSLLYDDLFFADSTKGDLDNRKLEAINDATKPIYCHFGRLFNRANVDGVYVYNVNSTQVGFADMLVFQWYDADKELIKIGPGDNKKNGEYLYLIKEPYVKISETVAVSAAPTTEVENPTIVVSDAEGKEILRAEIPIQKAANPNSSTKYLYMKLKYIDKETGLEVKPGTVGADVYLPYPDGMNYDNFKDYTVKLTHYTDEKHVTHENVTLEATLIGLKFNTKSFSPFLLEWTPKGSSSSSSSSGGSGGLSGVDITNRTNREILSYRLGGGLLTFRLAGSGDVIVTENGKVVKPDAEGWYTVSANARIVVDYPMMVLPKTGDMPVWRWLLGL